MVSSRVGFGPARVTAPVNWVFLLRKTAYNLIRMGKLLEPAACPGHSGAPQPPIRGDGGGHPIWAQMRETSSVARITRSGGRLFVGGATFSAA